MRLLAILLVAALCGACATSTRALPAPPPAGPASAAAPSGRLAGVALPPTVPVSGPQGAGFADLARTLGVHLDIVHLFRPYPEPLLPPDAATLATAHTLMLSWNGGSIPAIASGDMDDWITDQAATVAALRTPVLLRFRWEMDRPNLRDSIPSPATYITAWDRVRSLFDQAGATDVEWVWCPLASGFDAGRDAAAFYPGDDEVDWICADAYPAASPAPLASMLSGFLTWASGHDKPLMIGEFGVPRTVDDAARAAWLEDARHWLMSQSSIRAVVYFDLDVDPSAPVLQYGLDPGTGAAAGFARLVHDIGGGRL